MSQPGTIAPLRFAFGLLSVLPVGAVELPVDTSTRERFTRRVVLNFPVVGAVLAGITVVTMFGVRWLWWDWPLIGLLFVAIGAFLTRGLHLDGLADTVDGLAVSPTFAPDPERARKVMKEPHIGALAAVALFINLGIQALAMHTVVNQHHGSMSVTLSVVGARIALVWGCALPAPISAGSSLGSLVAGTVRWPAAFAWTTALTIFAVIYGRYFDQDHTFRLGILGVLAVIAGQMAAVVLHRRAVGRLGGVSGDLMGAMGEVAMTVTLLVMAIDWPH